MQRTLADRALMLGRRPLPVQMRAVHGHGPARRLPMTDTSSPSWQNCAGNAAGGEQQCQRYDEERWPYIPRGDQALYGLDVLAILRDQYPQP